MKKKEKPQRDTEKNCVQQMATHFFGKTFQNSLECFKMYFEVFSQTF